jgi:hypothetical protein
MFFHRINCISLTLGTLLMLGTPAHAETSEPVHKKFVTAQDLLRDSVELAQQVFNSGFRPTFLIALWRGGSTIGIAVTEYFAYKNEAIPHHGAVRTIAYNHNKLSGTIEIIGLDYVVDQIKQGDKILVIDDVVDSGVTMKKFLHELQEKCHGMITRDDIKVATVYYKPRTACITPDFYVHESDEWLVFPHELEGLTHLEILEHRGIDIQ